MIHTLREVVEFFGGSDLRLELGGLEDCAAEFRRMQPVQEGERAVIDHDIACEGGWSCYREILVPGSIGKVAALKWNQHAHHWSVYFQPEVLWGIHHRPDSESDWERRHYAADDPSGNKTFVLPAAWLRPATERDSGLTFPADSALWPHRVARVYA